VQTAVLLYCVWLAAGELLRSFVPPCDDLLVQQACWAGTM